MRRLNCIVIVVKCKCDWACAVSRSRFLVAAWHRRYMWNLGGKKYLIYTGFIAAGSCVTCRVMGSDRVPGCCCGSRLGKMAPLATPTFASAAERRRPRAWSDCAARPCARPHAGWVTGSVSPCPWGASGEPGKLLVCPIPGAPVERASPLPCPAKTCRGCRALPRPNGATPVILLRSGGVLESIGQLWNSTAKVYKASTFIQRLYVSILRSYCTSRTPCDQHRVVFFFTGEL